MVWRGWKALCLLSRGWWPAHTISTHQQPLLFTGGGTRLDIIEHMSCLQLSSKCHIGVFRFSHNIFAFTLTISWSSGSSKMLQLFSTVCIQLLSSSCCLEFEASQVKRWVFWCDITRVLTRKFGKMIFKGIGKHLSESMLDQCGKRIPVYLWPMKCWEPPGIVGTMGKA